MSKHLTYQNPKICTLANVKLYKLLFLVDECGYHFNGIKNSRLSALEKAIENGLEAGSLVNYYLPGNYSNYKPKLSKVTEGLKKLGIYE